MTLCTFSQQTVMQHAKEVCSRSFFLTSDITQKKFLNWPVINNCFHKDCLAQIGSLLSAVVWLFHINIIYLIMSLVIVSPKREHYYHFLLLHNNWGKYCSLFDNVCNKIVLIAFARKMMNISSEIWCTIYTNMFLHLFVSLQPSNHNCFLFWVPDIKGYRWFQGQRSRSSRQGDQIVWTSTAVHLSPARWCH